MAHTRRFNDDEMIQQQFPFKTPIIKYIFDKINYKHLYKLYQCCKFFPNKFPLIIIRQISDVFQIYNDANEIYENQTKFWLLYKFHLTRFQPDPRLWISKILICTIKHLRVLDNISLNDFEILTLTKSIEHLYVMKILNKDGMPLSVEDIVSYVPNANTIAIADASVTPETFSKLAASKRKCKISKFKIGEVTTEINADELLKFIEAHASNDCSDFNIFFQQTISLIYVHNLQSYIKREIYFQPQFQKFIKKPRFIASFDFLHP